MLESISPFLESKLALLLLWDERCGRSYTVPALRINLQMPYSQGLPWKTCPTTTSTRLSKNLPGGKIAMALTTLSSMRQSANPHKHSYFTDCRCVNEPNWNKRNCLAVPGPRCPQNSELEFVVWSHCFIAKTDS